VCVCVCVCVYLRTVYLSPRSPFRSVSARPLVSRPVNRQSPHVYIYIYIYTCVCVCVCVYIGYTPFCFLFRSALARLLVSRHASRQSPPDRRTQSINRSPQQLHTELRSRSADTAVGSNRFGIRCGMSGRCVWTCLISKRGL